MCQVFGPRYTLLILSFGTKKSGPVSIKTMHSVTHVHESDLMNNKKKQKDFGGLANTDSYCPHSGKIEYNHQFGFVNI